MKDETLKESHYVGKKDICGYLKSLQTFFCLAPSKSEKTSFWTTFMYEYQKENTDIDDQKSVIIISQIAKHFRPKPVPYLQFSFSHVWFSLMP